MVVVEVGRRGSATTVLLVSRGHDVVELGQANCVSDIHDQREIRIGHERTRDVRPWEAHETKRRDGTPTGRLLLFFFFFSFFFLFLYLLPNGL